MYWTPPYLPRHTRADWQPSWWGWYIRESNESKCFFSIDFWWTNGSEERRDERKMYARIDGRSEEYTYRRVIDPKSRVTLVETNFSLCSQFKTDVLCVSVSFSILSYISGRSSLHGWFQDPWGHQALRLEWRELREALHICAVWVVLCQGHWRHSTHSNSVPPRNEWDQPNMDPKWFWVGLDLR